MIKLPELDSRFTNVNDGGNTVRDLRLTRLEEALKLCVSEQQLTELEKDLRLALKGLRNIVEGKADKSELPKPSVLEVKVEPKEVPSTSLLENIIKLFKK